MPAASAAGTAPIAATRAGLSLRPAIYRWTTEQVSVLVMLGTSWTLLTIILPSSSTLCASVSTTTSYGPVTASTRTTPGISPIAAATSRAFPTSVWMRMYAWTTTRPLLARWLPVRPVKVPHAGPRATISEEGSRHDGGEDRRVRPDRADHRAPGHRAGRSARSGRRRGGGRGAGRPGGRHDRRPRRGAAFPAG